MKRRILSESFLPGLLSTPLLVGHKLNIAGSTYTTGWESLNVPIIAVDYEFCERSGATNYITTLTFSNRRAPFSGVSLHRPAMVGQPLGLSDGSLGLGAAGESRTERLANVGDLREILAHYINE